MEIGLGLSAATWVTDESVNQRMEGSASYVPDISTHLVLEMEEKCLMKVLYETASLICRRVRYQKSLRMHLFSFEFN